MKREVPIDQAHRLLAPRPTCLLTTRYKGQVNLMTIGWASSVSLEPPLIALAIHPSCYTHDMLERAQECVLNIPARPLAEQVLVCGTVSGSDADKMQLTGLTATDGQRVDTPWIEECLAHIECALVDRMVPGDHSLYIVQIVGAWAEEEAFDSTWLSPENNEDVAPLYHLGGTRFCMMGQTIQPTLPNGRDI